VVKGRVEVSTEIGTARVGAAQEVRLASRKSPPGEVRLVTDMQKRFGWLTGLLSSPPAYVHWSFDLFDGTSVVDTGFHPGAKRFALRIVEHAARGVERADDVDSVKPYLIRGVYGRALELSDKVWGLSDYPGVGGAGARTVAGWIRLEEGAGGIVAWGDTHGNGRKWRVCINKTGREGTVGALRTEVANGRVIATTDLRDGRWHHVASVFVGGPGSNVESVLHYVDGVLEKPSWTLPMPIDTDTTSDAARTVRVAGSYGGAAWHGRAAIDEVYVFEKALTHTEVIWLMYGRPPRAAGRGAR
jgi:hypothetical protein